MRDCLSAGLLKTNSNYLDDIAMPIIAATKLGPFAVALLKAGGVSGDEAQIVARSLVDANLMGHDSHGVMRIPYYLEGVAKGETKPDAEFTVIKENSSLLQADGNWGFGQIQNAAVAGTDYCQARESGVAVGTLIHCAHIGRLGEYCEQAAAAGMVSMLMVNTHGVARRVAPPGGKAPRLGTNPIAFGVPHPEGTLIMDFGTSTTAEGKVRVKKIAGQKCPDGWLLDNEGRPNDDPNLLYGDPPGTIRPFGGDQPHKGFALGLMVEIFAGAYRAEYASARNQSIRLAIAFSPWLLIPARGWRRTCGPRGDRSGGICAMCPKGKA